MEDSVTRRALNLQEIVAAIVEAVYYQTYWPADSDDTIFACRLVSSQWEAEASRLLWRHLEENHFNRKGRWHPAVMDLLAIAPDRQQKYASYVEYLEISSTDGDASRGAFQWLGDLTSRLGRLYWPRLQELWLIEFGSSGMPHDYQDISLAGFFQPRLHSLSILASESRGPFKLTDELLLAIAKRCSGLEAINLMLSGLGSTVTQKGLTELLTYTRDLDRLTIGESLRDAMSSEVLSVIAHLETLSSLHVPDIMLPWVLDLQKEVNTATEPTELFGSMYILECGISSQSLQLLLSWMPNLGVLTSKAHEGSKEAFKVIVDARLSNLSSLYFQQCVETTIYAADILRLAQNSSNLTTLEIPQKWNSYEDSDLPKLEGMDDDMLEAIITCLPELYAFKLVFRQTGITEISLLSFGRLCPKLANLALAAIVDFEKLVQQTPEGYWPELGSLKIVHPSEDEDVEQYYGSLRRDVVDIAEKLFVRMPSIWYLDLVGDQELRDAFYEKSMAGYDFTDSGADDL